MQAEENKSKPTAFLIHTNEMRDCNLRVGHVFAGYLIQSGTIGANPSEFFFIDCQEDTTGLRFNNYTANEEMLRVRQVFIETVDRNRRKRAPLVIVWDSVTNQYGEMIQRYPGTGIGHDRDCLDTTLTGRFNPERMEKERGIKRNPFPTTRTDPKARRRNQRVNSEKRKEYARPR